MYLIDVEIAEFLIFNKVKALTETVDDIAKAVTGSDLLQLSEDATKVKRKTDLHVKADADECTLYVESLPKSATHDYVKEIFSKYGQVVYVSLPRYKHSRRIKEFGFVEYESQEGLKKALDAFKQWNGVLVYEDADPDKLQSVVSFNEERKEEKVTKDKDDQSHSKTTEEEENDEPPMKKLRTESESTENQENVNEVMDSETKEEEEEATEPNKDPAEKTSDKKAAQKKKKSKNTTSVTDDKIFDVKIMPKREWKRLRNKYLNLQRARFKEIKQKLQAGRKQQEKKQQKRKLAPTPAPKTPINNASPRKINFYGALPFDRKSGSDENIDEPDPVPINPPKKPLFSFEPGLIVNIKFQEPLVDIKEFKQEVKALSFVKYIDVKEGQQDAFVRVDKFASANQLVKFYASSEYQTQILSGEVEQMYWQKMMSDREQKLNKTVKVKQVRGREKLSKKIAQHIRFDQ